jgi:hypothetical protein
MAALTRRGARPGYEPGEQIGKLTVVRATDERRVGCAVYECRCECGAPHYVTSMSLRNNGGKGGCPKCSKKLRKESHTAFRGRDKVRERAILADFVASGSLTAVAAKWGVSNERIRQIVCRVMDNDTAAATVSGASADDLRRAILSLPKPVIRRVAVAMMKGVE